MLEKEKNHKVVGTAEDMANLDAELSLLSLGKEEMAEKILISMVDFLGADKVTELLDYVIKTHIF